MVKVVVTGGIGSGKSLICDIFNHLGVPIYYADKQAKRLMIEDDELKNEIINLFGHESYNANDINREFLSNRVFSNIDALKSLNSVVHPIVMKDFIKWGEQFINTNYVIIESALAFNQGVKEFLDKIIVVTAPLNLRMDRVMKRDSLSREQVVLRMKNQVDEEEMIKQADEIIVNDGSRLIVPQVVALHKKIGSIDGCPKNGDG
ncbi:MAG: dephospho-CoA kinase [Bacteroidales bacterium]|nr:dephospho-CoA kinase [Bacteroidales bacterium]